MTPVGLTDPMDKKPRDLPLFLGAHARVSRFAIDLRRRATPC